MKKILLTNFNIKNFSGSEIDTLTIANYFLKNGDVVDIFTLEYDEPLKEHIDSRINIIMPDTKDQLRVKYDLIWAHHYPLLDYLLFTCEIKADYIHYVSLSSFEPYESLPFYYKKLTLNSSLSKEALNVLENTGYDTKNINFFPNYALKETFENPKKIWNKELKKICIVSNHIPTELLSSVETFRKNNIEVDIYGMQHNFKLVTNDILKNYDVVISIGKTVNKALALKIPVFICDIYGSGGYLAPNNIKKFFDYNFTGRNIPEEERKQKLQTIFEDVTKGYINAIKNIEENYQFAKMNFCFEDIIEDALNKIFKSSKIDTKKLLDDNQEYKKPSCLFIREMNIKIKQLKELKDNIELKTQEITNIIDQNEKKQKVLEKILSEKTKEIEELNNNIKNLDKKMSILNNDNDNMKKQSEINEEELKKINEKYNELFFEYKKLINNKIFKLVYKLYNKKEKRVSNEE